MMTAMSSSSRPADQLGGDHLDRSVREFMTPGVVTLPEHASLRQAFEALVRHRVHAVLIVGRAGALPLGWVTAQSCLRFLDHDDDMMSVREAIAEEPKTIEPAASAREALAALSRAGTTHLLVTRSGTDTPEGVVSALDLIAVGCR